MGEHLSGSVGILRQNALGRKDGAGNKAANQETVIALLAKIPVDQGGKKEEWGTLPLAGQDGMCPTVLGDAIYSFQQFWKANGTFKNIDGIVDPGGNTLRVLNSLVVGGEAKQGGPNGLPPANGTNLSNLASKLRGLFPIPSRWSLDNAPGVGAGFVVSGSIGQLDLKEDNGNMRYLTYGAIGGGIGWSPEGNAPVTFTASTRDMASATSIKGLSGMGRIFSRTSQPLTFEDMCGTMGVVSITGAAPAKFYSDVYEAATGRR